MHTHNLVRANQLFNWFYWWLNWKLPRYEFAKVETAVSKQREKIETPRIWSSLVATLLHDSDLNWQGCFSLIFTHSHGGLWKPCQKLVFCYENKKIKPLSQLVNNVMCQVKCVKPNYSEDVELGCVHTELKISTHERQSLIPSKIMNSIFLSSKRYYSGTLQNQGECVGLAKNLHSHIQTNNVIS